MKKFGTVATYLRKADMKWWLALSLVVPLTGLTLSYLKMSVLSRDYVSLAKQLHSGSKKWKVVDIGKDMFDLEEIL